MVSGLIGAYDLATSESMQAHVVQVLKRAGVQEMAVNSGAAFDPSISDAQARVPTDDPARYQRVAYTIRPGWQQSGTVIRAPQVAIWVPKPPGSQEQS